MFVGADTQCQNMLKHMKVQKEKMKLKNRLKEVRNNSFTRHNVLLQTNQTKKIPLMVLVYFEALLSAIYYW